MDFSLNLEQQALADEARALGRSAAAQRPIREDTWIVHPDEGFARELGARGWIGMTWPVEVGGGGRSAMDRFAVYEALLSEGAPVAHSWFADRQIGPILLEYGTEQQRSQWIPGIITADHTWCLAITEPSAGSDVASAHTTAERHGRHWIVNGTKTLIANGALADWCYLIARTDPGAPKHRGLSELVVDMSSPGVTVRPVRDMTDDEHFVDIDFEDVRVPASNLVGRENSSFKQVMRQMELERGGIDRLVANRRLFDDCIEHVRAQDPDALRDPSIRQEIATIETGYRIGRLLVLRETLEQAPSGFSAATKAVGSELEVRVANFCGRMMGPFATLADQGLRRRVARNICFSPGYTIVGGTSLILRNVLGERVLGLPR